MEEQRKTELEIDIDSLNSLKPTSDHRLACKDTVITNIESIKGNKIEFWQSGSKASVFTVLHIEPIIMETILQEADAEVVTAAIRAITKRLNQFKTVLEAAKAL